MRRAAQLVHQHRRDHVRRQHDGVPQVRIADRVAELTRVLGVAIGIDDDLAGAALHVRDRVDYAAMRVERASLVVDAIAERVERLAEAHDHAAVVAQQLVDERRDLLDARRLVVLDDVAGLAGFLQKVLDERLGLEGDQVADRRGDEEHLARPRGIVGGRARERFDAGAGETQLEATLDAARARTRATREEERVIAALDQHARVRLQHVLVERVPQPSIDLVGPEVVHEERQHRVREQVLAGAVRRGWQAGAIERVAEHDRVHVRQMRRYVDDGAALGEAAHVGDVTLDGDAIGERAGIDEAAQRRRGGERRDDRTQHRRHETRRERVHLRIEISGDVPRVRLGQAPRLFMK